MEEGVNNKGFQDFRVEARHHIYLLSRTCAHVRRPNESKSDNLCCLAQHLRLRMHREFAHLQPDSFRGGKRGSNSPPASFNTNQSQSWEGSRTEHLVKGIYEVKTRRRRISGGFWAG